MRAGWTVIAAFGALLTWVSVDGYFHQNHRGQLNAALGRGDIGLPTAADERAMSEKIGRWLKIAGVKADFAVDEPPKTGRLNVYFTTPKALAATGVGYGNAAYDPSVDAIYIDQFFVDANPYQSMCTAAPESSILGCREEMPSQQVMLAFVFFHELGHRQLHGVGSSAFASRPDDPRLRRMEDEADRFSLQQLKRAYSLGQSIVADPDHALADTMGFGSEGDHSLVPNYQVWVDLFGALTTSSLLNGFLPAPYSPFYHDLAHPTLYDRTRRLMDVALEDSTIPANAASQFRFFQQVAIQEAHIPDVPFVEVTVPEPITDVTFTETGIAALTVPNGAIYSAAYSVLNPDSVTVAPRIVHSSRLIAALQPVHADIDYRSVDLFWGYGQSNFVVAGRDGDWRIVGSTSETSSFPVPTNLCFRWWSAPSPSYVGLAAICPDHGDQISVVTPTKLLATTAVTGLQQAVRQRLGDRSLELDLFKSGDRLPGVTIDAKMAYIPIIKTDKGQIRYCGILSLSLPDLQIAGIDPLPLPGDLAEQQPARALFVTSNAAGAPTILVTGGGRELKPLHWGVWLVTATGEVKRLMERPFLLALALQSLSPTTISNFDPYMVEVRDLGSGWALVNLSGEGVFLVDLRKMAARLLYGYGGTPFRIMASNRGLIALYVPGAGKILVFTPDSKT